MVGRLEKRKGCGTTSTCANNDVEHEQKIFNCLTGNQNQLSNHVEIAAETYNLNVISCFKLYET